MALANLNAFVERLVRSAKHECLNQMAFFLEGMLRPVIAEYKAHYHEERNHQGLGNQRIAPRNEDTHGSIRRRKRLGGMLNYYYREAA